MLLHKIKEYGEYMVLSNHYKIQTLMKEILEVKNKYFDKQLTDKVKQIKKEVTENIEQYIKIEEISKKYNVSSRAFLDCFKEIYGKTYYAFIKEFRIKKAAGLLWSTDSIIAEIAIIVGYQNASKFSKAFSDIMGVTPTYFRKNDLYTFLDQEHINGVEKQI